MFRSESGPYSVSIPMSYPSYFSLSKRTIFWRDPLQCTIFKVVGYSIFFKYSMYKIEASLTMYSKRLLLSRIVQIQGIGAYMVFYTLIRFFIFSILWKRFAKLMNINISKKKNQNWLKTTPKGTDRQSNDFLPTLGIPHKSLCVLFTISKDAY